MENRCEQIVIYTPKEFQTIHRKCIGSSAIAAIAGVAKYQTPLSVWAHMVRGHEQPENDAMWLGTQMQPIIRELWHKKQKYSKHYDTIGTNATYHHPEHRWAIATPDYLVCPENGFFPDTVTAILEIKNTGSWAREIWEAGLPTEAHCQVIWQLGILRQYKEFAGLNKAYIAALIGADAANLAMREVEFSQSLFDSLLELGEKFMNEHVRKEIPPEPGGERDSDIVSQLTTHEAEKEIDLTSDAEAFQLLESYKRAKTIKTEADREIKGLSENLKKIENTLKLRMNGFSLARFGNEALEIKTIKRAEYTCKATSYQTMKLIALSDETTEKGEE